MRISDWSSDVCSSDLYRADHLGGEQDVFGRYHPGQQVDSRLMVDAGVEEDVVEQQLVQRRALHVLREPAVAAPVVRHRAAAMRDDEFQRGEVLEQIRQQELHENRGVAAQVMRAGMVEIRRTEERRVGKEWV